MSDSPNYCQHPECHNSRIVYYARTGNFVSGGQPHTMVIGLRPFPGARRWCHVHALLNEGIAFGRLCNLTNPSEDATNGR